jgi:hypothetical protein
VTVTTVGKILDEMANSQNPSPRLFMGAGLVVTTSVIWRNKFAVRSELNAVTVTVLTPPLITLLTTDINVITSRTPVALLVGADDVDDGSVEVIGGQDVVEGAEAPGHGLS